MNLPAAVTLVALVSQAPPPSPPPQSRDSNRQPVVGTGLIGGTVTSDEPGATPVRGAVVRANGFNFLDGSSQGASIVRATVTDDQGRYVIPNLPAGRFYLTADKGGWVSLRYGAESMYDAGVAVAVTDGQPTVINMKLSRGAVIAGRVTDEHGQPQSNVRPVLLQYRTVSGQRRLVQYFAPGMPFTTTNDLGEYRFFGIAPGSYVVALRSGTPMPAGTPLRATTDEEIAWARQQASSGPSTTGAGASAPPTAQSVMFAPIYHPGVTDMSAAVTITVAAGEQRLGVDFVTTYVPTAQVRGVVLRPDGSPAAGARLSITRARVVMSPLDTMSASATADAKGAFTFGSVASGDFLINARGASRAASAPAPGAPRPPTAQVLDLWGTAAVTIGGRDMSGVTLTLQQGLTVSGRLSFEAAGNTTPPASGSMRMMLSSTAVAEGGAITGNPAASMSMNNANADGTFSFQGIAPGRYVLSASGAGMMTSWMMKAVMVGGRNVWGTGGIEIRPGEDVSDVTVVLTDQIGEVSGTLLDSTGRPAPEYHILIFPTDKNAWTQASQRMRPPVRPASDGKFRVSQLLAGDYYVAALSRFDPANLFDAAFLEQVAAAAFKITLAEGEKKVQDLKIK
jgi:hypothetical protein